MKSKIKRIGIAVLVLVLIASAAIFIFHDTIIAHFTPIVEQVGTIHIKVKNDTSYVSAKLIMKNKSFLEIKIDTIKYQVSLFNKIYLQNTKFLGIVLPGYGNDSLDFSLKIPHAAILKDLIAERKKSDSANYSINVFLQYATIFGKSERPINKSAKLKIPQPPELKIEEVKWKKIRLKHILADVKIKIINYSPVALSIKDITYSMAVLEHGNLKGNYREAINIKPKGATFITIPIEIDVTNIGKTIFQVLVNKDKYNYTLTLNAILESTDPLKKNFYIDLTKNGKMELKK